jgi:hypothetical protein
LLKCITDELKKICDDFNSESRYNLCAFVVRIFKEKTLMSFSRVIKTRFWW